ncbi:hypothetical protein J2D73_10190 [Acetobacter sacchari]|uniref:Uncharacterized protein n=2 Tax=Acetobacter sacchari TaxID=2661687 RepID=A0ABS3LW75_9PROT|nr:hypothetical protein [Acetobacter sacchari]
MAGNHALAQTTGGNGSGIGAQVQSMSQEGLTAFGYAVAAVCYCAAFALFVMGGWAFWKSRNERQSSPGLIGMGFAGFVLAGIFATAPGWINKSANTASGGQATVGTQAQAYQFTGGN